MTLEGDNRAASETNEPEEGEELAEGRAEKAKEEKDPALKQSAKKARSLASKVAEGSAVVTKKMAAKRATAAPH